MEPISAKRGLEFSGPGDVQITIATNAGACFGVVRALRLGHQASERARAQSTRVYSLGPLIHNPTVVRELEGEGLKTIDSPGEAETGTVLLRSHGVQREVEASLRDRGIRIVDATCPLVKKPQRIAQSLGERGFFLILVGDAKHPEVKGVLSYYGRPDHLITYDPAEIAKIPPEVTRVGIIAQTTIEARVLESVAEAARARFDEVLVYNTICDATSIRQSEALELARRADIVVVVGGKNSSNTNKLVKICRTLQPDTHHIEELSEIEASWFRGKKRIGVTGGASTPHEVVDRAGTIIADMVERKTFG